MKTILVPIDFSDNSKNAMDYAILLANKMNMKLLLLHAFHPSMVEALVDAHKIAVNREITGTPIQLQKELKIWKEVVDSTEKNIQCEAVFAESDLADAIIDLMNERPIDLIVMGTKGASGLKEVFVGSNTSWIIEKSKISVIAVPAGYEYNDIKRIVFATDYHDSDIDSIKLLVKLSKRFNAKLDIVHIADGDIKPRFEDDLLEHFMKQVKEQVTFDAMAFHLLDGDNVNEALNEFITKQKADLFAISTEERFLVGPLFIQGLVITNVAINKMKDLKEYISKLRYDFSKQTLDESEVNSNPLLQFEKWFREAIESGAASPNAMVLATASKDAIPSARVMLLRNFNENGFVFYTNYHSKKGLSIDNNPHAALIFFWPELERQIRIEGTVEKQSPEVSDEYFAMRPDGSKLGAWSSQQSTVVKNRAVLDEKFADMKKRFQDKEISRPAFWGGYTLKPSMFEFWQGRPNRFHDRITYVLDNERNWKIERLSP